MKNHASPDTLLAQLGHYLDSETGGLTPPFQPATTFARHPNYDLISAGHIYSRDDNSLYRLAETLISQLEHGEDALLWPSGLAAVSALISAMGLGRPIFVQKGIYYGVTVWTRRYAERVGLPLIEIDATDLETLTQHFEQHRPGLIWIETPSNPLLETIDISAVSNLARQYDTVLAVDSTAATPIHSHPLDHGADIVMHSATKSLNGHSDVLAGVLVAKNAQSDLWQALKQDRHDAGNVLGSFETWLLLRGMRTLAIRVRTASSNAAQIAQFLQNHKAVETVRYPGLETYPGHQIAARQMHDGFGSLLSFDVVGDGARALEVAGRLKTIIRATSLGGVETLVEHRHTIEGQWTDVPANLLRLAVGIEAVGDLIADLDQALG